MNPRHLEARWRNAVQKFTHLQKLIAGGYVLYNGRRQRIDHIQITQLAAGQVIETVSGGIHQVYTWKDANCYRMGLTIQQFNAQLLHWHCYPVTAVRQCFTPEELSK